MSWSEHLPTEDDNEEALVAQREELNRVLKVLNLFHAIVHDRHAIHYL